MTNPSAWSERGGGHRQDPAAEELLAWVGSQGFVATAAHCYAAEGTLAYAPVVAWLRSPAISQRLAGLEPVWLGQVARLLPELLTQRPDLPSPGASSDGWQRQNLFEATARGAAGRQRSTAAFCGRSAMGGSGYAGMAALPSAF